MSGKDEKLPCLHELTKRQFLVSDGNMGLCLYTQQQRRKRSSRRINYPGFQAAPEGQKIIAAQLKAKIKTGEQSRA